MMRLVFQWLFGCTHARTTFPLTASGRGTYIVCLDCGKEFPYNWEEMRVGKPLQVNPPEEPRRIQSDPQPHP